VGILAATVQEHHLGRFVAPLERADGPQLDAPHRGQRARHPDLFGVLVQQPEFVEAGQLVIGGHNVDPT
jgi:hypothetical protein